jgi:hypothetical protein
MFKTSITALIYNCHKFLQLINIKLSQRHVMSSDFILIEILTSILRFRLTVLKSFTYQGRQNILQGLHFNKGFIHFVR